MKLFIGIDPGLNGGLVGLDEYENVIFSMVMPTVTIELTTKITKGKNKGKIKTQQRVDARLLYQTLNHFKGSVVYCEKAAPIFGVDTNTNFRMGHGAGVVEGVIMTLGYEWNETRSTVWQKEMWLERDYVTRKAPDKAKKETKRDTKATSLKAYERLRGSFNAILPRCKKPHDGLVDAFLIARYGLAQKQSQLF